jgi:hypothetical protein
VRDHRDAVRGDAVREAVVARRDGRHDDAGRFPARQVQCATEERVATRREVVGLPQEGEVVNGDDERCTRSGHRPRRRVNDIDRSGDRLGAGAAQPVPRLIQQRARKIRAAHRHRWIEDGDIIGWVPRGKTHHIDIGRRGQRRGELDDVGA